MTVERMEELANTLVELEMFDKTIEELKEKAAKSLCACFTDNFHDYEETLTLEDIVEILSDSYYMHRQADETWKDCPEWATERAEAIGEMQMEEARGN